MINYEYITDKINEHEEKLKRINEIEKCLASVKAELRFNTLVTLAILGALLGLKLTGHL